MIDKATGTGTSLILGTILHFLAIFSYFEAVSQEAEELGIPYIRNYSRLETSGHSQNWDIVQDHRGVMYFANTDGILEHDGVNWRLIKNPTGLVFALALDGDNTVYAGTKDDLGYLTADSTGTMEFVSLRDQIDSIYHDFTDVRRVYATKEGVYFIARRHIFRWQNNQMTAWDSGSGRFHISEVIDDRLYVRKTGEGLFAMEHDSLRLIPGGEYFADLPVYVILPYNAKGAELLIGTSYDGFFLYEPGSVRPFPTNADDRFKKHWVYHGVVLPDGTYAITTVHGGLFVMDNKGQVQYTLNRTTGILSEGVNKAFIDRQGALWLALQNGISRIDVSSPLTLITESSGVTGFVQDFARHNGSLYVAMSSGVYFLERDESQFKSIFRRLDDQLARSWSLLSYGEDLLIGSSLGVFQLNKQGSITRVPGSSFDVRRIYAPDDSSNTVYVGAVTGLFVLERNRGQWRVKGRVDEVNAEIHHIYQEDSLLWLGTFHKGIYRLGLDPESILNPRKVNLYDTLHGLPSMVENIVSPFRGGKVFPTHHGIYKLNPATDRFEPDFAFGDQFGNGSRAIYHFKETANGTAWVHMWNRDAITRNTGYLSSTGNNDYTWLNVDFAGHNRTNIYSIYVDRNDVTWFGSVDRIIRYDGSRAKNYDHPYSTLIRRVVTGTDSLLFGGMKQASGYSIPGLRYENNAIRFQYAATSYDFAEQNKFQYMLEGFDENWSEWSSESQKDYTNLPEGNYTFKVRAINTFGITGNEDFINLTILPPWYRSWWAYLIYSVLTIGFVQLIILWRSAQLKSEKERLEKIVAQRTDELAQKTILLEEQTEKLKELDKIKSNFFANVSHEFRTPLTLIRGPLDAIKSGLMDGLTLKHLNVMRSNTDRLLRLVNQLLDLSRLESGTLKMVAANRDIVSFIRGVTLSFETLAIEKNIDLSVQSDVEHLGLYFDRDKMEKILYNLLSNAFKYTGQGGSIKVIIREGENEVSVWVKDTGTGIEAGQLPHVFDRFYQADSSNTRLQEGSGIGLALSKELVELHKGRIEVSSTADEGSEFVFYLPKGKDHFKPEQIVTDIAGDENALKSAEIRIESNGGSFESVGEPTVEGIDQLVVLIVEDNKDVRDFITEQLDPFFNIAVAINGKEGYAKAKEIMPDLVVSDVMMPEMDGFEMTKLLKTDVITSHVPVILLTAKAESEDKIGGLELGADDYLTKPFDGKELIARINNLIKVRSTLWERISRELAMKPAPVSEPSMEEKFISEVVAKIETHMDDPAFSVEKLSEEMAMSRIHLHRKLKATTGQSASHFIRQVRLRRARQLLEQNSATVTEIAYQVGFNNMSYFAKCFKEEFGLLPSEFEIQDQ